MIPFTPDLSLRRREPELMDDPGLEHERHLQALTALRRVNQVSFGAARLWAEVKRVHAATGRPVRVLDLACGGGDLLASVARRADARSVPVELHGCDVSAVAVAETLRAGQTSAAVDAFQLDVLHDPLPDDYDVITTSLFLHHLDRPEAVDVLTRMAAATRHSLFVQDLRRTRAGYALAWIGLHTLTRSDVARRDGLVSVRSAFTLAEVAELCTEAGIPDAEIRRGWPQRFTVRWERR